MDLTTIKRDKYSFNNIYWVEEEAKLHRQRHRSPYIPPLSVQNLLDAAKKEHALLMQQLGMLIEGAGSWKSSLHVAEARKLLDAYGLRDSSNAV